MSIKIKDNTVNGNGNINVIDGNNPINNNPINNNPINNDPINNNPINNNPINNDITNSEKDNNPNKLNKIKITDDKGRLKGLYNEEDDKNENQINKSPDESPSNTNDLKTSHHHHHHYHIHKSKKNNEINNEPITIVNRINNVSNRNKELPPLEITSKVDLSIFKNEE